MGKHFKISLSKWNERTLFLKRNRAMNEEDSTNRKHHSEEDSAKRKHHS